MSADDLREVYKQDCESFRYQDRLFWSRFQTLSVIEGAAIGVIFTETIKGWPAIILSFGTLFIVGLISILAIKDRQDGKNFIDRIMQYERENKLPPIEPKPLLGIDSLSFTIIVSIILTILNIFLIFFTFQHICFCTQV